MTRGHWSRSGVSSTKPHPYCVGPLSNPTLQVCFAFWQSRYLAFPVSPRALLLSNCTKVSATVAIEILFAFFCLLFHSGKYHDKNVSTHFKASKPELSHSKHYNIHKFNIVWTNTHVASPQSIYSIYSPLFATNIRRTRPLGSNFCFSRWFKLAHIHVQATSLHRGESFESSVNCMIVNQFHVRPHIVSPTMLSKYNSNWRLNQIRKLSWTGLSFSNGFTHRPALLGPRGTPYDNWLLT